MDGQRRRFGERKESSNGVNHSRGRYKQRSRNSSRMVHRNGNKFTESRKRHSSDSTQYSPKLQPVQEANTSSTSVESDTKGKYTQIVIALPADLLLSVFTRHLRITLSQVLDIPGFFYDPVKKRYFKQKQGQRIHFAVHKDCKSETATPISTPKVSYYYGNE